MPYCHKDRLGKNSTSSIKRQYKHPLFLLFFRQLCLNQRNSLRSSFDYLRKLHLT